MRSCTYTHTAHFVQLKNEPQFMIVGDWHWLQMQRDTTHSLFTYSYFLKLIKWLIAILFCCLLILIQFCLEYAANDTWVLCAVFSSSLLFFSSGRRELECEFLFCHSLFSIKPNAYAQHSTRSLTHAHTCWSCDGNKQMCHPEWNMCINSPWFLHTSIEQCTSRWQHEIQLKTTNVRFCRSENYENLLNVN